MKAFHKVAGAARKRLFRRSVKDETEKMDAAVRTALVDDVQSNPTFASAQQELEQIEAEIDQARSSLRQSEEKEIFLGQRSRQYRKALDERARQLKEEQIRLDEEQRQNQNANGEGDEESAAQAELDAKMEKWERDEDALQRIVETHKQILGHCETMRWRLKELEAKRKACRSMVTECTDFLTAAEDVRNRIHQEADDDEAATAATEQVEGDPMIQIINDHGDATTTKNTKANEKSKTKKNQIR